MENDISHHFYRATSHPFIDNKIPILNLKFCLGGFERRICENFGGRKYRRI